MELCPLGSTGLHVTPLGFGGWQLGGKGWGTDKGDREAAVRRAVDVGLRLFDTAPVYGFGRSEERLGRLLRGLLDRVVIVSKGGLAWDSRQRIVHDNRPESLREQLHASLRRLGRSHLDVFLLHWPDPAVPLADSAGELENLRLEGKIRAWGVSNYPAVQVAALGAPGLVLQYPVNCLDAYDDEYRSAAAAGREVLAAGRDRGWGFLAFDTLARGLLGGGWNSATTFGKRDVRSRDRRYAGPGYAAHLERARRLADVAESLGTPPAAVAIRAVLDRAGVAACLVGMTTPAQVDENVRALTLELPAGALSHLDGGATRTEDRRS